jgi:DNA-binding NtrC family response regulator
MSSSTVSLLLADDYSMPGMDGLATLNEVRKRLRLLKVIILTVYEHVKYAIRCLQMGAMDSTERRAQ